MHHGTGYAPLSLKLANKQNALIQSIHTDTSQVKSLGCGSKPPPVRGLTQEAGTTLTWCALRALLMSTQLERGLTTGSD